MMTVDTLSIKTYTGYRQHVLSSPDPRAGREAVRRVAKHLHDPRGGVIAQFEFGPGSHPATARAIEEWELIR